MFSFYLHEGLVSDHSYYPLGLGLYHLADLEVAAQQAGEGKGLLTLNAGMRLLGSRTGWMFRGHVPGHLVTLIPSNLEITSLLSASNHCSPFGSLLDQANIPEPANRRLPHRI